MQENPDRLVLKYLDYVGKEQHNITYSDIHQHASRVASYLTQHYAKGDRVVLLFDNNPAFIYAFFGCIYAQMIPVPANPPMNHRQFDRLKKILADSEAKVILTEEMIFGLAGSMAQDIAADFISVDRIEDSEGFKVPDVAATDICYLQYTSGSTGNPKGVMITHGNIMYQVWTIYEASHITPEKVTVSWLPSFHDMGFISGYCLAIFANSLSILLSPVAFLKRPFTWLKAISEYKAQGSFLPNFGFGMCTSKVTDEELSQLDLSSLIQVYCGGEPVREATITAFQNKFAKVGLPSNCIYPCYGMAEAVLMISVNEFGEDFSIATFNRELLKEDLAVKVDEEHIQSSQIFSCGRLWGDTQVKIVDPETKKEKPTNGIGEVWVKGSIVAPGYWEKPQTNEEIFNAALADTGENGWLRTGDYGAYIDRDLYITGRLKHMIILRGRNFYPEDIEHAIEGCHPLLRLNNSAVFSEESSETERIILVQEAKKGITDELNEVEIVKSIQAKITQEYAISFDEIVIIPNKNLPKTTSGKIQRNLCKNQYQSGLLNPIFHWKKSNE